MNQYGPTAQHEVQKALREFNAGTLKSSSGQKVTKQEQAVAIGISKARARGAKVPNR